MNSFKKTLTIAYNIFKGEIFQLTQRHETTIPVKYFKDIDNWGDHSNVDIIQHITKKRVLYSPIGYKKHLLAIGSVMVAANKNSIVWGSGFISDNQILSKKPKLIKAVRGPLTQRILTNAGLSCPSIFGDPALLISEVYPELCYSQKTHDLGIILHYEHENQPIINALLNNNRVKLINIKTTNTKKFLSEVNSCKNIASSSLHGIIAADSYKIPNCRLIINNMNNFKFDDYHLGIGVEHYPKMTIKNITALDIIKNCKNKKINFSRNALVNSFPYEQL
ncbi:polysaccharide pyruvyl transferase family protein [Vibrio alfacsensis]|uniref:polysaccharide pyruvyl transferase family protein n=1 Tax=Vibrio alfacsensis TaxID=1074311 RepID=UPI0040679831